MKNIFLDECGSTNDVLKALIRENRIEHLDWIGAKTQTAGRGRNGNSWSSVVGGFYWSVFLKGDQNRNWTWIPLWIGLAAKKALLDCFSNKDIKEIKIKWPNDLVFEAEKEDKKLGGVLCESIARSGVIVGVGINWHQTPQLSQAHQKLAIGKSDFSLEPTSVFEILKGKVTKKPEEFVSIFLRHIESEWNKFGLSERTDDFSFEFKNNFMSESYYREGDKIDWLDRSGHNVKDVSNELWQSGKVIGLGDFGELRVLVENGTMAGQEKKLVSELTRRIRQ
jgi:biotin-[acetyl-CoA-carboxylase] ligase BirA-like protein